MDGLEKKKQRTCYHSYERGCRCADPGDFKPLGG